VTETQSVRSQEDEAISADGVSGPDGLRKPSATWTSRLYAL